MAEILEKISNGLLKVLSWFKNPELIKPEDLGVEVEEKIESKGSLPTTLGELLDNLDCTFKAYKTPTIFGGWLSRDEIQGLKKLGAHVPNPWLMPTYKQHEEIKVNTKNLPGMMLVSIPISEEEHKISNKKDSVLADFMFGIKCKKLPWNIQKIDGIPYKIGMAYRMEKKFFWICAWLVVHEDGSFEFCKEHTVKTIYVTKGKNKGRKYDKKIFKDGALIEKDDIKDREFTAKCTFKGMVDWWQDRQNSWSVAVKQKNERVTFGVDKLLTKKYFVDREKTVKTITGQNKKIIHYVREHDRYYGDKKTTVKAHIRGLNEFTWKGYQCLVTAPEFQTLVTSEFNVSAEVDVEKITKEYVSTSQVGAWLAEEEERRSIRR
jgi:hypothetical protein